MTADHWIMLGIALLGLGLVAGPVMHIMPTRQDRQREALRADARRRGMRVQLRQPPEALRSDARLIAVYQVPLTTADARTDRSFGNCLAYRSADTDDWLWDRPPTGMIEQLRSTLDQLPPAIIAVDLQSRLVGFYWQENGDAAILDEFVTVAHRLESTITGRS